VLSQPPRQIATTLLSIIGNKAAKDRVRKFTRCDASSQGSAPSAIASPFLSAPQAAGLTSAFRFRSQVAHKCERVVSCAGHICPQQHPKFIQ